MLVYLEHIPPRWCYSEMSRRTSTTLCDEYSRAATKAATTSRSYESPLRHGILKF